MTGQQLKQAMQYRQVMHSYRNSGVILEEAECWIEMELHNQAREIQSEVAADLREEKALEMKRAAGQGDSGLRLRLKNLLTLILPHLNEPVKRRVQ